MPKKPFNPLLPPKQLGPPTPRSFGGRATALIVEDDRDAAFVTHGYCDRLGVDGVIARSVADALVLLGRFTPDFILLDLHLPERDGVELLELARDGDIDLSGVLVVATTGVYARRSGLRTQLAELGVTLLLPKPFHLAQLAEALGLEVESSSGPIARPVEDDPTAKLAQGLLIGGLIPLEVLVEEAHGKLLWLSSSAALQTDGARLALHLKGHSGHPELPLVLHGRVSKQIELMPGEHEFQFRVETTSDRHGADRWLRRLNRDARNPKR